MSGYLDTAKKAAREAGKIAMRYHGKDKEIKNKGRFDLVTEVDIKCEKKIIEILKSKFPDHGFIIEEGDDFNTGAEYVWVIDPIDGTTSFSHNYPMFSISIALFKEKVPLLGVVYIPFMKEIFYAESEKGAFLNDKKISVTETKTLEKSLIATGFPYNNRERTFEFLKKFIQVVQGIRRSGSAAVDICYVACGRLDGYWELGLKIMDTAAAQIILNESGGKVTDFNNKKIEYNYDKIVASNGKIHNELIKLLR